MPVYGVQCSDIGICMHTMVTTSETPTTTITSTAEQWTILC